MCRQIGSAATLLGIPCFAVALTLVAQPVAAIDVVAWGVGIGVDTGSHGSDARAFSTVQNPFVNQHSVTLPADPNTTVAAQYDFAWGEQFGQFLISSQEQAHGLATDTVHTEASGGFRMGVAEPLPMHIEAAFSYSLPADYMVANLLVTVFDAQNHVTIFGQEEEAQTLPGEPASGVLIISSDVLLPPGPIWTLRYSTSLDTYPGTAGFSAVGSGSVLFSIPEPSSLCLALLPGLMQMIRRSRRR